MRTGISVTLTLSDRRRLDTVIRDRNSPQKHTGRVAITLLSADGVGTNAIMRWTGKSKTCVWRWQERFMEEGVDGLPRYKTRPSASAPAPCAASGAPTVCSRTTTSGSSCRTIRTSSPSCATSSGCTSIRLPMPSSCRSTRRARSRRSTALSRDCP